MSNFVSALATRRILGSSRRKHVFLNLADKACDDGSGIWAAKTTISRETEMSRSTVIATINDFVNEGLLMIVGHRRCASGATVEYSINMDRLRALPSTDSEPRRPSSPGEDVRSPDTIHDGAEPGKVSGARTPPVRSPDIMVSGARTQTILEPSLNLKCGETDDQAIGDADEPQRGQAGNEERLFERYMQTHPRPRNRSASRDAWNDAIVSGADPEQILKAAAAYADEQRGSATQYVKGSDTWLTDRRWRDYVERAAAPTDERSSLNDAARFWAEKVKGGRYVAASAISNVVARTMINQKLVTVDQLRAIGVAA